MEIATADSWYQTAPAGDGVTHIWEPHVKEFYRCNIWHLRGRDRDLLIDSGMGVVSLRDRVALVAERPLLAVASHSHFDHIGSHHEFDERLVHAGEADVLAAPTRDNTLIERYVDEASITALPRAGYRVADYAIEAAPATRVVADGDVVDLGDRAFEVLHLPGHSPGSIGLWEAASGVLFSGDAVYDGPLLDELPGSDIPRYVETMKRLKELPVSVVHAGHEPSFGRERLRELADAYLSQRA